MSDLAPRPVSDEEWEALVRQLRNQPTPRPRSFFYARVQARLAADGAAKSQVLPGWLRRPAYAALLGALVMSLSGDGVARPPATANQCPDCAGAQQRQR